MTIILRCILGSILATGVALLGGIPFPIDLLFVLTISTLSGIWGDKFILGFMSLMRYFR